jgi:ribosomal protein L37AE/L43A
MSEKFYPYECGWCGTKYAATRNVEAEDPHDCWVCGRKTVRRVPFPKVEKTPAKAEPSAEVLADPKQPEAKSVVIRPASMKPEPKGDSEVDSTLKGLTEGDDGSSFRGAQHISQAPFGKRKKIVRRRDRKCPHCGEMFTGQGYRSHEPFCKQHKGTPATEGVQRQEPQEAKADS